MKKLILLAFFFVVFLTPQAWANRYYLDVGAGYGAATGTRTLLGSGATDGTDMGLHTTFAHEWQRSSSMLTWALGLQPRLEVAGGSSFIAAYAVGRTQIGRFYLGAGFAPLVKSTVPGAMGILGEIGIDFKIIPTFSVVFGATGQSFIVSGGAPFVAQAFMAFRFYTDPPSSRTGRYGIYDDYEGWRYPYGEGDTF